MKGLLGGGDRPNLVLAQVQEFCPGPGQDLSGTWPGLELDLTWDLGPGMGPGMGPGPELDNIAWKLPNFMLVPIAFFVDTDKVIKSQ